MNRQGVLEQAGGIGAGRGHRSRQGAWKQAGEHTRGQLGRKNYTKFGYNVVVKNHNLIDAVEGPARPYSEVRIFFSP